MNNLNIKIAYYSGTGGTELVAKLLSEKLSLITTVDTEKITTGLSTDNSYYDMLILLFPVHAFNAPEAVYSWLKNITSVNCLPAIVLSISGGGEISPNTASRVTSIKLLKKKGFDVRYESTIVMPCNFFISTPELISVILLKILPDKVEKIVADIKSGVKVRIKPFFLDRVISFIGRSEQPASKIFGRKIKTSAECNSCAWCSIHCPSENIIMRDEKPIFLNKCHMCLKCVYGCPQKALTVVGILRCIIIKDGYNLTELINKIDTLPDDVDIDKLLKGYLWKGVREYISIR